MTCTFQHRYLDDIVRNPRRNAIIIETAARLRGLSLILVERIQHGEILALLLNERYPDLRSVYIHGSDSANRRESALTRAREGRLDVLIGTEILGEGVNVPAIRNLIVARAGRAPHRTIQAVGRGTRAHDGKDRVIVIDFSDSDTAYTKEGKPKAGPLTTQANARRKTYESEEAYSVCDIGYEELTTWLT